MDRYGKKFEQRFKQDFLLTIPESTIDRLQDGQSGYKSITNISDFIGYSYPNIFYLECKTKKGTTFPFQNLTQYDKLIEKVGIHGVRAGVVLWFYEYDKVYYIPISTITKMKQDNKKSIHVTKSINEGYFMLDISSTKIRTYMHSDYSVLKTLIDGQ